MSARRLHGTGLSVLVIHGDRDARAALAGNLEALGCTVTAAADATQALAAVERCDHDLAFLDLDLGRDHGPAPDRDHGDPGGLQLLPSLLGVCPRLEVVVVTAYATIQTAVETIQRGARDYLPNPF